MGGGVGFLTLCFMFNMNRQKYDLMGEPVTAVSYCLKWFTCCSHPLLSWTMEGTILYFLWTVTEPEMTGMPVVLKFFAIMLFSIKMLPNLLNGVRLSRIYA